ncbi:hypothetical protein F5Y14DRAFT_55109 [Nemania sp. NC0429]|nr:hypothetical protein F5Y14DRAFT_55109 [Nemania sp. NC0429]
MTFQSNPFWGSSEIGTIRCPTPPELDLFTKPPNWDCLSNFKEVINPESSLALLQGPLPCHHEPRDEWLAEFQGLQKVHDRAPTMSASTTLPHQNLEAVMASSSDNSHTTGDSNPSQPGKRKSPPAEGYPPDKLLKTGSAACLPHHGPDCDTPTPRGCQCVADGQNPDGSDAIIYAPTLLPCIRTASDIETTMRELRELELAFQTDTKLRKSQIAASRPG